jgi:diaminopimelate decarboxylase
MFTIYQNQLYAEQVAVADIAQQYGTPCYIYSRQAIESQWQAFANALQKHPHRICYAVKANSNLAVLNVLARLQSGFDIVSEGELTRVIAAGGNPQNVIFSGVAKSTAEITLALEKNIFCFNVESAAELMRIEQIAKSLNKRAPIALRINPNIDAGTHPYISTGLKENKFGIVTETAMQLYQMAAQSEYLSVQGIACHLGSQLLELDPFLKALDHLLQLIDELAQQNIILRHLDIGGGLGVCYHDQQPPAIEDYGATILSKIADRKLELVIEPGRAIVANAGILVTQVEYLKHTPDKNFAIVDAGMNDLLRPALYEAWQTIVPVCARQDATEKLYDVVGPVCETADFLGKERLLQIAPGDLLAVMGSGAYGFTMSSNYNSRPRIPEVMVDGNKTFLIRKRETIDELFVNEAMLPE